MSAGIPWRLASIGLVVGLGACQPFYPACEQPAECKVKEYCVQKSCAGCRQDADCPVGELCRAGACVVRLSSEMTPVAPALSGPAPNKNGGS